MRFSSISSRFGLHCGINFGLYAIPFICREKDEDESEEDLSDRERCRRIIQADANVRERVRGAVVDMAEAGII